MKAAVFYKPKDIRVEEVEEPKIKGSDEAIVRITYSCICGSDLWYWRGLTARNEGSRIGHEFIGVVESVGKGVKKIKKGDFVIAPFSRSCGKCPECKNGIQSSCRNRGYWGLDGVEGGQGEKIRVSNADVMLFKFPKNTKEKLMPSLLTLSDVLCTGYHAAISAGVGKGATVAVIGDGAVGLCAVLASKFLGAKKIILLSTHKDRAKVGKKFGATTIIAARGKEAAKKVLALTGDAGADCVLECVGTRVSWEDAFSMVRRGGRIGWVGVPHDVAPINMSDMFSLNIGVMGGVAPAANYIPKLLPAVLSGKLDASAVFTKTINLADIKKGYEAMDRRSDIKVLIKF